MAQVEQNDLRPLLVAAIVGAVANVVVMLFFGYGIALSLQNQAAGRMRSERSVWLLEHTAMSIGIDITNAPPMPQD